MLTIGTVLTASHAFTSPIGCHFLAGDTFTVDLVGRSTRCTHDRTGSVVWVQGSSVGSKFVTA